MMSTKVSAFMLRCFWNSEGRFQIHNSLTPFCTTTNQSIFEREKERDKEEYMKLFEKATQMGTSRPD